MEMFIARQPIFNAHLRLFGYELLYRGTEARNLQTSSADQATTSVLTSTFLTEGIDKISESRPCFINFTANLLLQNIASSFPRTQVVVEILEDVPPTPGIIKVCRELKQAGYTLALDDFIYDPSLEPLLELADIVKFDCLLTPVDTLLPTLKKLQRHQLKYLAEKIETRAEFEQARKLGFSYFQGYFFRRPERIGIREIAGSKLSLVNLLAEVNRKQTTVSRLETIIKNDVAISYKLLRYINSSYFYRLHKIDSVSHAITYLGGREMRRFVTLVIISELATDKPQELVRLALVRARFLELLMLKSAAPEKEDELFLLGLFSLLDAMLDVDMEYIGSRLPLSDNLHQALVAGTGPFGPFLQALLSYEEQDRQQCLTALRRIGVAPSQVGPIYLEAIDFARSLLVI